jgi:type IV pilus assembly protein PilE
MRTDAQGFSLIELLVAVCIAGLLAALALPSWQAVVRRVHRQEARLALLQLHQTQERHYLEHQTYRPLLPTEGTSEGGRYALQMQLAQDGQHYVLQATPRPGGSQAPDLGCALLSIDDTGQRLPANGGCWP